MINKDLFKKLSTWIVISLIILIPVLISLLVSLKTPFGLGIAGDTNSWVGFYGNYIGAILGAIIGAFIAILVMKTESKERNSEARLKYKLSRLTKLVRFYYLAIDSIRIACDALKVMYIARNEKRNDIDGMKMDIKGASKIFGCEGAKYHTAIINIKAMFAACNVIFKGNNMYTVFKKDIENVEKSIIEFSNKQKEKDCEYIENGNDSEAHIRMRAEIISSITTFKDELDKMHIDIFEHINQFSESIL